MPDAEDVELDLGGGRHGFVADEEAGAKSAATVVDLGLREVERVGAFDVAGAHVVADGVADDLAARVDDEREFRFGDGPGGIAANFDLTVGACDFVTYGFEEELGAFGSVDAVVEVAASGVFGFGDAGAAAAVVGYAGGPDLLIADGGEERGVEEMISRWSAVDRVGEVSVKIVVGDEGVKGALFERISVVFMLDEEGFGGAVEDQGFRPFLKEEWILRRGCDFGVAW